MASGRRPHSRGGQVAFAVREANRDGPQVAQGYGVRTEIPADRLHLSCRTGLDRTSHSDRAVPALPLRQASERGRYPPGVARAPGGSRDRGLHVPEPLGEALSLDGIPSGVLRSRRRQSGRVRSTVRRGAPFVHRGWVPIAAVAKLGGCGVPVAGGRARVRSRPFDNP
jgi:hypothetical protein